MRRRALGFSSIHQYIMFAWSAKLEHITYLEVPTSRKGKRRQERLITALHIYAPSKKRADTHACTVDVGTGK